MKLPFKLCIVLGLLVAAINPGQSQKTNLPPPPDQIGFCKPYNWLSGGWVAAPRMPLLGDVNGDGYTDFLDASPADKIIDISLNGKGWKPMRGHRLMSDLPDRIAAMTFARSTEKVAALVVLGESGGVLRAENNGNGGFRRPVSAGNTGISAAKAWIVAGRFTTKSGPDEVAAVYSDGRIVLLNAAGERQHSYTLGLPVTNAAAGDTAGDGSSRLAISTGNMVNLYRLGRTAVKTDFIKAPAGQEALAMGDINGDGKADILVNGKVFLAPKFRSSVAVPGWDKFDRPVIAMMGDVVHHGRADVVVQHEGRDYFGSTETDCDVYITYFKSDKDWDCDGLSNEDEIKIGSDPLDRSTSHDGIPDGWKEHGFAGIDLRAMGASPLHKDVFVLNLVMDNVPTEAVERQMKSSIVPFFAKLPYSNIDGTEGFAIHWMTQTPSLSTKENAGKSWQQIAGEKLPIDKVGLCHWMLVNGLGGGGQSNELAEAGSSGMGSWIHEFGHQLGLSHSGKYETWAPTYTSLMNYSYSYQFDGDGSKVHFSNGELAGLVLNESHLPGKVNYPIEKLKFLEGRPYHLHLKAADANSTYIDWGWTGVFTDRTVRANITYGYGVGAGERLQPSGTQSFHYDGPFELMTDYQASLCEHQGKLYMATASRPPVAPTDPRPKSTTLVLQTYKGKHAWTDPVKIAEGVTNDPCLVSDGASLFVFYATDEGVKYQSGSPTALSEPKLLPDSKGCYVSGVNWHGSICLFLYRGKDVNISYRLLKDGDFGPETDLGFKSTIPPGPAIDTIHDQLLLGVASQLGNQPYKWQLRRFQQAGIGFREAGSAWVGGEKSGWAGNRRPSVIFNPSSEFGPNGKIYFIAAGVANPANNAVGYYVAQTIGYKDTNDGWLLWRYYDEWTNTRSGVAAAWFDNDITIATTWASGTAGGDGGVYCANNGMAIGNVDMGDFDDVSLMANFGMSRSIATLAVMPAEGPVK